DRLATRERRSYLTMPLHAASGARFREFALGHPFKANSHNLGSFSVDRYSGRRRLATRLRRDYDAMAVQPASLEVLEKAAVPPGAGARYRAGDRDRDCASERHARDPPGHAHPPARDGGVAH